MPARTDRSPGAPTPSALRSGALGGPLQSPLEEPDVGRERRDEAIAIAALVFPHDLERVRPAVELRSQSAQHVILAAESALHGELAEPHVRTLRLELQ